MRKIKLVGKAYRYKLKNRRVEGCLRSDGTIVFKFKRLVGKEIMLDHIALTPEALLAMVCIAEKVGNGKEEA